MRKLTAAQREELRRTFGDRAVLDREACLRCGQDAALLPAWLRSLFGRRAPDAIVQPASEEEAADLVRWAAENGVALTPRGRATSLYGGPVPVRGGVVVDVQRLDRILDVNAEARTATVQAGAVWEALDRHLAEHDLALRLYPTSYHRSTVGGWLAQGGAGIGSYEAGWFRDNVLRARVVLPDGTPWELRDREVSLVSGAEGTTGLITELTLRVQRRQEVDVAGVACPDAHALEHLFYLLFSERVPLWSLSFLTPPLVAQARAARPGGPPLPDGYLALLAFRPRYRGLVVTQLPDLLGPVQGARLSEEAARHVYDRRFELGSLGTPGERRVPADVVVPLSSLGDFFYAVERRLPRPVAVHGMAVRGATLGWPEAALHGFRATGDGDRLDSLSLAFEVVALAEEHGGRPYGTGLYFAPHAAKALGSHRAARLAAFKSQEDPPGRMNPGKVFGRGRQELALRAARFLGPALRPFARWLGKRGHPQAQDPPESQD
jgi:FAD/FMN-containing dehydrogenase